MLAGFAGNAIMTKAKAMYGQHLTAAQYQELIQKKNVAEIAAYLRDETPYGEALAAVRPGSVHRGQLENLLRKSALEQYAKLLRYDSSTGRSYYRALLGRAEIDQILQMVRLLNSGHPEEYAAGYPAFLDRYTSFRLEDLARVRSFTELIRLLDSTPYAAQLRPLRPAGPGQPVDYTACERVLQAGFYQQLEALIGRLFRGRVRSDLLDIEQTNIELFNICNLYRQKKFFPGSTAQQLRATLLPCWHRIGREKLEALLAAPTAEEFVQLLVQSRFAKYLGQEDFVFIEYRTDCIRYHLARRFLHFAADAPTAFTAFITLKELEIDNIVTAIEGVRYQLPPDEIRALLIL